MKKGVENVVAHNLSRIVTELPDKFLAINRKLSWHVDMVNYLVTWQLLIDLTAQNKRFFLSKVRNYIGRTFPLQILW